jgi:hypothetical protein
MLLWNKYYERLEAEGCARKHRIELQNVRPNNKVFFVYYGKYAATEGHNVTVLIMWLCPFLWNIIILLLKLSLLQRSLHTPSVRVRDHVSHPYKDCWCMDFKKRFLDRRQGNNFSNWMAASMENKLPLNLKMLREHFVLNCETQNKPMNTFYEWCTELSNAKAGDMQFPLTYKGFTSPCRPI